MAKAIWILSIGVWYIVWNILQRKRAWMFRYEWIALIFYMVLSFLLLLAVSDLLH